MSIVLFIVFVIVQSHDTDDNPHHPTKDGKKDLTPCRDHDCFYAEKPYKPWTRPVKRNIFTCSLCGRKLCDDCAWMKRRHLIHLKHFRNYSFELPHGRPIDVEMVMAGLW